MKQLYYIVYLTILFYAAGCTKESATNTNTSNTPGTGGSLARFTLSQDYLYAVDGQNLYSYDLKDPANPLLVNTLPVDFNVETIFPYEDKLFIGSANGMYIYSISNPGLPVKLGSALHVRSCDPVVANDSVAYVTLASGSRCGPAVEGLYVQDIKNLLQPVLKNTLPMPAPYGLGLKDTTLYVCCRENGLKVFNVANAYNPVLIKTLKDETFMDVIPANDLLICYVSAGLLLYDISSPQNPQLIKKINN